MRGRKPTGAPPLGTFSWHELATSDNEAAFAFYSGLFGWDAMQRMDMGPTGVYLIFGENGVQRGGMYIKPPDMPGPPNWLPYAHVPSADEGYASLRLSNRRQGSCAPMDVPGGGRIANRHRSGWRRVCGALACRVGAAAKPRRRRRRKRNAEAEAQGESQGQGQGRRPRPKSAGQEEGCQRRPSREAKKGLKKVVKAA